MEEFERFFSNMRKYRGASSHLSQFADCCGTLRSSCPPAWGLGLGKNSPFTPCKHQGSVVHPAAAAFVTCHSERVFEEQLLAPQPGGPLLGSRDKSPHTGHLQTLGPFFWRTFRLAKGRTISGWIITSQSITGWITLISASDKADGNKLGAIPH